jgi:hypothetical protein
MFKQRKDFRKMKIQDLVCWVPPPGKVYDHFKGEIVDVEIYARSAIAEKQRWEIPPKPEDYTSKRRKEKAHQKKDPSYFDSELEKFRRQEWFRRINGFWFMNNGKPVYVTGQHYFYMSYWKLDTGYPDFRWPDLQYFYFWQYCMEDPDCGGMLTVAQRRQGKTYRASCSQFEVISRVSTAIGGIQSKNKDDAKKFFIHHIVEPFKKLPDYFKPEYDKSQGTSPKNELRFFATSKRGEVDDTEDVDALNSLINYGPANEKHYDGWKLKIGVLDEFGKTEECSVVERHRTIKFCITEGTRIVGKLIYTTTVEEMAGGRTLEESKLMWEESDPTKRDKNGRTPTLLYRFFIPAYESHILDGYGMPRVNKAKAVLNNIFDTYRENGDYVGLASEMRKNPMTIEDVFRVSSKAPIFNIIILQDRLAQLMWRKERDLHIRGNLVWVNGERDTRVKFVESPNGRFLMRILMQNDVQNLHRPINKHKFVIGCDPYEHKSALRPSDGASYGFKKFDPNDPEFSNSAIFEYCARPSPNVFFEDHIKACVYFGSQILVENNRIGMINYFLDRGYGDFLIWFQGATNPGIFAGDKSKQLAAEYIDDYVNNYSSKIFFPKLLEDMISFDISDSTKYDRTMAFGWTLVAAGNLMTQQDIEKPIEIGSIIRSYKI